MLELKGRPGRFAGMRGKALFIWICAIIFGPFLLLSVTDSESFRDCQHNRETHQVDQAEGARFVKSIGPWTQLHLACAVITANENNGALTALAGIVVAIFTGTLWWVTRGMVRIAELQRADMLRAIKASEDAARAAEKSAEAAVGVEIPRLAIQGIEFLDPGAPSVKAKLQYPKVASLMKNHGRTPAFIEQESLCFRIGLTLPRSLKYDFAIDLQAGKSIESGDTYRLERTAMLPKLDEETISEIIRGTNNLWVYGYMFYNDFLRLPHWFNFRAHYLIPPSVDGEIFEGAWYSVPPIRPDDYGPEIDE